ncbi:hypothetical protein CICLE_v10023475mg [Citrus x clementina]|uniref:beta-aspartyl-peptidase n=1 Tax=Citrus clementina TaxID=85681 RepID=V4T5I2_CITCL|nr:hypothetical protein CICLE_v10023475mg [Citrus x clementina]
MGWAIALHGGPGDIPVTMPPERRQPREAALRHCLDISVDALKSQKYALDVVELVVRELENNSNFNAGKGSVLINAGTVEMEACIMDGNTKRCGARLLQGSKAEAGKRSQKGPDRLIVVSASGEVTMPFNTIGMFRACATEDGYSQIGIWTSVE